MACTLSLSNRFSYVENLKVSNFVFGSLFETFSFLFHVFLETYPTIHILPQNYASDTRTKFKRMSNESKTMVR